MVRRQKTEYATSVVYLFATVGVESVVELRFCADDGYRTTGELASSDEILNG